MTVTSATGSARFQLALAEMRDDVVSVDYGWWHPEWEPGAPLLGGMEESNANLLTLCRVEEPMVGTWSYNAIPCWLEPWTGPFSWTDSYQETFEKGQAQ